MHVLMYIYIYINIFVHVCNMHISLPLSPHVLPTYKLPVDFTNPNTYMQLGKISLLKLVLLYSAT